METKILLTLCALIFSLGSNVEGQDLGAPFSPSDGPLTLGMSGAAQAPLLGGSPSPPGSLSLPSTDSPKPTSNLTDGGLFNNNNSSSSDTAVVVVGTTMDTPLPLHPDTPAPPPTQEEKATSVGVPTPLPIPEKAPGLGNLTEETVQPSVAPSDYQTAPTQTSTTTVLVHKPPTTAPHTPVHSTTPSCHAPHPSTHHPKTHSPITPTASPASTRPETHPTNTSADTQTSSSPSPNPETSNPKQPLSPVPTTTTTTSPPAVPTSEPQPQTSRTTPLPASTTLPASTPASSPPSQAKTHADIPSQLNVVDGEPVFHSGAPALDPLLAGLVSAFIVTAAIITLLLFIKLRRRDQRPEFRRLQDLPMDDMMEDTPLSMYSY